MAILQLLQSLNNYLGLITLVVGLSAFYLYMKQKKDRKRDAAKLILQEIRYAEQQIRESNRGNPVRGYMLASKLLPTNSWNDNIHLFIKDLKETEIDLISRFYSQTAYVDSLISERSKQKINPNVVPVPPMTVPSPSATAQLSGGINPQQPVQYVQVTTPAEEITIALLRDVSSSIEFLYNTPAVEKLRQISERKWYQIV